MIIICSYYLLIQPLLGNVPLSSCTRSTTSCDKMSCETIPTEILCQIFLSLCKKPIAIHVLDNRSHFDVFPWAVGQVCRPWRETFLSYPSLWTSLSLKYIPDEDADLYPGFAEMNRRTTLYLERSRQLPLTIVIVAIRKFSQQFPRAAWRSLLSCSNRWKGANLVLRVSVIRISILHLQYAFPTSGFLNLP